MSVPRYWMVAAALLPARVLAAGGAHVVDDAEVETPGHCHLEGWATRGDGQRLVDFSPACTPASLPKLEIGASVTPMRSVGRRDTSFGPSLKLNLRPVNEGLGIGASAGVGWSTRTRRIETAAAIVPLTLDIAAPIRLNVNLGWTWTRTGNTHAAFAGAQANVALHERWSLMVEAFDRSPGRAGGQAGLRFTPRDWVDIDLLGGRYVDGVAASSVTLGLTLRR